MPVIAPLAGVGLGLAGVAVLGLLGGSDDGADLGGIARRLDAREDPTDIERRLDDLEDAIDALVADADLDRHLRDPPAADAASVEKAEALSRAVERGQLSVGPSSASGSAASGDDGTVATAAGEVRRETSPSSAAARQLLDRLKSPDRADADEIEASIDEAVAALDARAALERAFDAASDDLSAADARRITTRLDSVDAPVAADVCRLAERVERGESTAEARESERDRVDAAADTLTAAAVAAADLDVGPDSGRPTAERLSVLADAVERDELGFAADGDSGEVGAVAGEVRRTREPESAVAKRLLDRLASPGIGDLRPALDTAVEQLDEATTTHSVVANLDRESVRGLADDVADRLDAADGPVADALEDRVETLRGELDRADESNAVIPYAVRHELRFYDRTLVAELDAGTSGAAGGASGASGAAGASADADVSAVTERREQFENRYVDGRRDHNHSIPLHFLSLVDELVDEAEQARAGGDGARAAGLAAAADETLDHVEQLYERNEYSVMLRRLRG